MAKIQGQHDIMTQAQNMPHVQVAKLIEHELELVYKCNDLKALLAKFGGHSAKCASRSWKPRFVRGVMTKRGRVSAGKKCNCGWDEALKGK